jgi:hypothetical protein
MNTPEPRPDYVTLPSDAGILSNQGIALRKAGQLEKALDYFLEAEKLDPLNPTWRIHTANVQVELGDMENGIQRLQSVVREDPGNPQAHWQLAYAWLLQRRYAEAWPEFAWRWRCPNFPSRRLPTLKPAWDGKSDCQRLLLWSEQGLGDEVMMTSLIPEAQLWLAKQGGKTELLVDGRLVGLLQRAIPGLPIHPWERGVSHLRWDQHLPLGDLGRHLRPSAASFPRHLPAWLKADPCRVAELAAELPRTKSFRCGLSWRSEAVTLGKQKSLPLPMLAEAIAQPGAELVCLQYGDVEEELLELKQKNGITVKRVTGLNLRRDLEGQAALINSCDLVVSISNATAHISGAMGKPTWTLLHQVPYWPWGLTGQTSPWQPKTRLFRQQKAGEWQEPLEEARRELHRWLQATR